MNLPPAATLTPLEQQYRRSASLLLIGGCFLAASYVLARWGVEYPHGIFLYALVVALAGSLLGSLAALWATGLCALGAVGIATLHASGYITPDLYWQDHSFTAGDAIVLAVTLSSIAVLSWLSTHELKMSLHRARRSEERLAQERDELEKIVEERTKALREAQLEQMMQLSRFAEFGKLAGGIFHDLINPLTAVTLSINELQQIEHARTAATLQQALAAAQRLETFMAAARKQIQLQHVHARFCLNDEIEAAIDVTDYKARQAAITVNFFADAPVHAEGNPLQFYQIVSNLVSNAIDAYEGTSARRREVRIDLIATGQAAILRVRDWGSGIPPHQLTAIFDPFFTTKPLERGTGIGLAMCKETVERDFGGTIAVVSTPQRGTVFTVRLPVTAE